MPANGPHAVSAKRGRAERPLRPIVGLLLCALLVLSGLPMALPMATPDPSSGPEAAAVPLQSAKPATAPAVLPIVFEPNVGQLDDGVAYYARIPGGSVSLLQDGAVLLDDGQAAQRIHFTGASPSAPVGVDPLASYSSYFESPQRQYTRIPHFAKVVLPALYPGVDAVFYGGSDGLEFDFNVQPMADAGRIALALDGPGAFALDADGRLTAPAGLVIQPPTVLQDGAQIAGAYTVDAAGVARFHVGRYDPARPLVIDPKLGFSTFLGGTGDDVLTAAKSYNNFLYVAGYQLSAGSACTPAPNCNAPVGVRNPNTQGVTVMKLDPTVNGAASLVWISVIAAVPAQVADLDVDAAGIYFTASTAATTYYVTPGAYQNALAVGTGCSGTYPDAVLTMLSLDGASVPYSTYFGGAYVETGLGVAGGNGKPVMVGVTGLSFRQPLPTFHAFQPQHNGPQSTNPGPTSCGAPYYDGFVARFDPAQSGALSLVYGTYLGGTLQDAARAVTFDAAGNLWVAGSTSSTLATPTAPNGFPGKDAYADNKGAYDAFVVELTGDGQTLLYGTEVGGGADDLAQSVVTWGSGAAQRVALAGWTKSGGAAPPLFPFTAGPAHDKIMQGTSAGFVTVLDPTQTAAPANQLLQSTFLETGTAGDDTILFAVQADPPAAPTSLYVEGATSSGAHFPRLHAWPALDGGTNPDLVAAQFPIGASPLSQLLFATAVGGTASEQTATGSPTGQSTHPGTLYTDASGATGPVVVGLGGTQWPVSQSVSNPRVSLAAGSPPALPRTHHATAAAGLEGTVARFVPNSEPFVVCGAPSTPQVRGTPVAFTWAPGGVPHTQAIETYDAIAATDANYGLDMTSLTWDFGDGTTLGPGNFPTPSHTYAPSTTPATMTVTFTARDTAGRLGSGTCSVTVYNTPPLSVCRTTSTPPLVTNQPIQLSSASSSDRDGTVAGYAWSSLPDGSLSSATAANPTVTFPTAGRKTVALTVTDNNGKPSPTLRAVAQAGSLWVAVGDGGAIYTSPDAATWTPQASGTVSDLRGVDHGGALWIAVGQAGTVLTSPDGLAWTPQASGTTRDLDAVDGHGTVWVAAGAAGTVLTSPDGVAWTQRASGTSNDLHAVANTASLWTVTGDGGFIATSPDAATWTSRSWHDVAFGAGQWVAVADGGLALTSPDGYAWTARATGSSNALRGIAFGAGRWVAVGDAGTVLTSADAITWASNPQGATSYSGVAYSATANVNWVAVGAGGAIRTATDPTAAWAPQTAGSANLNSVAFGQASSGPERWVAVGNGGASYARDATGNTWSAVSSGTASDLLDVAFGASRFVAVGTGGTIRTWDGTGSWATASGGAGTLRTVARGPTQWITAGDAGTILASPDGVTPWALGAIVAPTTSNLESLAYASSRWTAVGAGGISYTSTNGQAWAGPSLRAAATDGTQWAFAGTRGLLLVGSPTGTWSVAASGTTNDLYAAAYGGSRWVVAGQGGALLRSLDAVAWAAQPAPAVALRGIALGASTWVAVGDSDASVSSPDAAAWAPITGICWLDVQAGAPPVTCAGPATLLVGQTGSFTATGGAGSYGWSATGPASPATYTGSPYDVAWSAAGTYTVTVTAGSTASCSVVVSPTLACSGPSSLVAGASGTFTGQNGADPYGWSASGPATPSTFTGNPYSVSWSAAGSYTVTVSSASQTATCTVTVVPALSCSGPASLLVNTAGSFNAASGGPSYSWSATGPASPASFTGNPYSVSWTAAGSYTVTVTSGSESADCSVTVTAAPPPLACSGPSTAIAGAPATFTASGGTGPYAWSTTGSASPASGSGGSFSTTWSAAGAFAATVTTGAETATCNVTVQDLLTCAGPATLVAGQSGTFTASGAAAPYSWAAVGASPASFTGNPYAATWGSPGSYTVQVTAGSQTATCSLAVAAALSCSGPATLSLAATGTFTAASGAPPYSWTATGPATPATFTGNPYGASWSAPGAYSVQVTSGTQTATCLVTISGGPPPDNQGPTAAFSATPNPADVGQPVSFTDTSVDPDGDAVTGWSWTFGDGGFATSANPSHTYGATGTYTVCLRAADVWSAQGSQRCATIQVNQPGPPVGSGSGPTPPTQGSGGGGTAPPAPPIAVDAGADVTVAPGVTVDLRGVTDPAGAMLAWRQLYGPTVALSGAGTDHATFTAPAQDAVLYFELDATDGPSHGSDAVMVTVRASSVASTIVARAAGDTTGTVGDALALDATASTGPDPLAFAWQQLAGPTAAVAQADAARSSWQPTQPGTYLFAVTVRHGAETAAAFLTVTVAPAPESGHGASEFRVDDLGGGRFRFTPLVAAERYDWTFGSEQESSAGAIVHSFAKSGQYDVGLHTPGRSDAQQPVTATVALSERARPDPSSSQSATLWVLAGAAALALVVVLLVAASRRQRNHAPEDE